MTSLIAANSAWSSASDSRRAGVAVSAGGAGGAFPGSVMAADQYSPTECLRATPPGRRCDGGHAPQATIAIDGGASARRRLVQPPPRPPQLSHRLPELLEIARLAAATAPAPARTP